MDRNIEHFEGRLEKDTYSKEDVAKMLHNEADFTAEKTRKEFDGFVSKEDFDAVNTSLTDTKAALEPYQKADFDSNVETEFGKLNGLKDKLGDFKSIAKLTGSETQEEVAAKVTEFKDSENYGWMFSKEDAGGAQTKFNLNKSPKTPSRGIVTPKIGIGNLFNRKSKS